MLDTRVYAVAGAKGGVGKTTTSCNLATAFASRGASAVVVELDLGMANIVDFLSLDTDIDAGPTMHDVLAGDATVTDAIRSAPGGIDVVPSGVSLDGFAATDVGRLSAALPPLTDRYERVLLDTGAGLSRETVVPLGLADEAILVSTPRVAAVRDVEKTKRLATRVDTPVGGVVFTKSGTGKAPPPPELADFLGVELLGHVPDDTAVPDAQDAGTPVVTNAPDSPAATAYSRIATTLDKRAVQADTTDRSFTTPTVDAVGGEVTAETRGATDGGSAVSDDAEDGASASGAARGSDTDQNAPETGSSTDTEPDRAARIDSTVDEPDAASDDRSTSAKAADGETTEPAVDVESTVDEEATTDEADRDSLTERAKSLFGL